MRSRWTSALAILAGYTALGLFLAAASSLTYISTGGPPYWGTSIKRSLGEWWAWAALTPGILYLARRWPIRRGRLWRSLCVHLGAMIGIGVLKLVVDHNVRIWLFGRAGYLLLTNLAYNLLVYWAIVATAHGIEYYRTGREREVRASQLEARLAEARLQQLSMQLQPHFLFNTLNAIAELVHGSPDTADRMIAGLSVLLRETLADSSARAVPLRRELSLLGCYVDIQRVRFGPRLDVRVDAPPDTLDAAVPALLLQPLVENAIRHGLGSRSSAGRIEIAAARAGDRLTIRVRDDGAGLREGERGREGVGLANTRARLQALFGADVSLDVSSAGQGGVEVAIDIPCRMVDAV